MPQGAVILEDNTLSCQQEAERLAGMLLVAAAITLQSEAKRRFSTTGPPSRPGQYPRFVTGTGREATGYEPEDPAEAGRLGSVRVGWSRSGDHMGILEIFRGRKGLRAVAADLRGQLQTILDQVP